MIEAETLFYRPFPVISQQPVQCQAHSSCSVKGKLAYFWLMLNWLITRYKDTWCNAVFFFSLFSAMHHCDKLDHHGDFQEILLKLLLGQESYRSALCTPISSDPRKTGSISWRPHRMGRSSLVLLPPVCVEAILLLRVQKTPYHVEIGNMFSPTLHVLHQKV